MDHESKIREQNQMGNLKNGRNYGFQNLLYTRFIVEKKYPVEPTAKKMGIHKDTLYRYIRGENEFPVDRLPDLVYATGDPFFLEYLVREAGFAMIPKSIDKRAAATLYQLAELIMSIIGDTED